VGARPTRRTLQPEATGAGMEVTKCLKPPDSGHEFGGLPPGPGGFGRSVVSLLTLRWREMDSNHRYPRERSLLLPRSKLARRNRLAAGTGCRLQRAKVSAYSNVSNGAEREPPILRISLFAGAHARCRAWSAGGRSRPCSPNIPRCARERPRLDKDRGRHPFRTSCPMFEPRLLQRPASTARTSMKGAKVGRCRRQKQGCVLIQPKQGVSVSCRRQLIGVSAYQARGARLPLPNIPESASLTL
jgi:hypothetical protein